MNDQFLVTGQLRPKFNRSVAQWCALENEDGDNITPDEAASQIQAAEGSKIDNKPDATLGLQEQLDKAKKNIGRSLKDKESAEAALKAAQTELSELKSSVGGAQGVLGDLFYDVEGLTERFSKLKDFEAGLLKDAKVDEGALIEQGKRKAETELRGSIKAATAKLAESERREKAAVQKLREHQFQGGLKSALAGVVKPAYVSMVISELESKGHVAFEDDNIVCYDIPGVEKAYDIVTESYQSAEDFLPKFVREKYPQLVEKSTALQSNNPSSGVNRKANPFAKDTFDGALQAAILSDPMRKTEATRLMREAGLNQAQIDRRFRNRR